MVRLHSCEYGNILHTRKNYGSMRFSVGEAYATTASLPGE